MQRSTAVALLVNEEVQVKKNLSLRKLLLIYNTGRGVPEILTYVLWFLYIK